ncbi:phage tail protein [Citrobacter freundii]|uniref:phage tail protein n=1 Tax=Citrobacter freundii TaxID=546 RepID=UPI001CE324CF|nr:phage tail protein [Citrobacter freundii]
MTAKYFAILTNQGAARLANAAALGTKLNLTQMAVGDANGVLPTPDPAQTKLINQKRIAPLNLLTVDPANTSQIIAEQIIPENEGGFWIREIGLYDDDGILIAVANCPETYKPELQEGSGRTQTIRMILIVSSTSAITLKIDPSVVLATRQYVDDKVIEVKSYADGLMRAHEQSRNHPDATTTAKGFTQLNSSVTDDRETQSATPKAVKIAMDNANARLAKERNLSDLPNPALARQNLQLGDSSTKNTGTTANTVAAGDDARITGAMQKSQNGADIQDVAKFLQNIGLDRIEQTAIETRIKSPGGGTFLVVDDSKWGCWIDGIGSLALGLDYGGTGAKTASGALANLGIGPIATAAEVTSGTSKKLVDAARLVGAIATDADIQNATSKKLVDALGLINAITTMQDVQNGALRKLVNAQSLKNYLPTKALGASDFIRIPDVPGGTIIQYGQVVKSISEGVENVVLPTPFPNSARFAIAIPLNQSSSATADIFAQLQSASTTGINFYFSWSASSTPANGYQWFAIGY